VAALAVLATAGLGFGLIMPGLTRTTTGATAVWIRHAGLVAGLLVITPLLTADLTSAGEKAELRGIATTLDAPASARTKLRLAVDLAPMLTRPARKELPNFTKAVAHEHDPALTAIGRRLDHVVQATVTRAFRRSFLVAAFFALLAAVVLVGRRVRAAGAAVLVGAALVGAELAAGAASYGARPRLLPACADRPSERGLLKAVDFLACRLHKSREQFVADAAGAGVDAAEFVNRIERLASLLGR
jgi:hypothetical protein